MSEMIERVAKAIQDAADLLNSDPAWEYDEVLHVSDARAEVLARAAIEAMREPASAREK